MNDFSPRVPVSIVRPEGILDGSDGVAVPAWQAFNAMEATKRRHFECLEIIDEKKKKFNIDLTEADRSKLASLLKDHDEQVKRFTRASQQLKSTDAAAHAALFAYIGAISSTATAPAVTH